MIHTLHLYGLLHTKQEFGRSFPAYSCTVLYHRRNYLRITEEHLQQRTDMENTPGSIFREIPHLTSSYRHTLYMTQLYSPSGPDPTPTEASIKTLGGRTKPLRLCLRTALSERPGPSVSFNSVHFLSHFIFNNRHF